ncbi:MAG: hypothetical protein H0X35_13650 [Pseudonocardiales bacterium]|nr:hypothetical protein [Pseudonocardiales bacterium]
MPDEQSTDTTGQGTAQTGAEGATRTAEGATTAPSPPPAEAPPPGEQGKPNGDTPAQKPGEFAPDWKARSRQHEDRAKQNKVAADTATAERDRLASVLDGLRKALDPDGAGKSDDPADIATRAVAERESAAAELRLLKVERGAEKAARQAGADVDALLDSRAFLTRLEKLDPADATFADDVKSAVEDTLKDNPRLKAQQSAPSQSATADMSGGGDQGGGGPQTIEEIREARRKRRGTG